MKKIYLFLIIVIFPMVLLSQNLSDIKERGKIKVAFTTSGKNTVNQLLAQEFAKFLDVKYEEIPITWKEVFDNDGKRPDDYNTNPTISYVPDALKKADFICGTIYEIDWRKKFFSYAGIVQVSDLLIIRKDIEKSVYSKEDLKGLKIAFLQNSTYETNITRINEEIGGGIEFVKTDSEDKAYSLLRNKKVDGLITVSYLALTYVKENAKNLKLAFPVAQPQSVGWAVRSTSVELQKEIKNFFETIKGDGTLDELFRKKYRTDYSTYIEIINSYAQSKKGEKTRDYEDILRSGKIIIALRDREMVYHKSGKKQFNHYLAEKFAEFLGLHAEIVITPKFSKYFEHENGEIFKDSVYMPPWFNQFDVACDLIAPLDWRLKKVDVIPFMPNAMVVIGRTDVKIGSVNDLMQLEGVTSKGSSYEHALRKNNITNFHYNTGNNFFKELISGKAQYTISNISVFNLADYPELEAKFIIGEIGKMGWAIKKNQPELRQKILEFFEYAKKEGILDDYFKEQTGMTMNAAENYLTVLHETYQVGYFPFVFYGTEQGLPQEDVISIYQDDEGYMWLGTHAGAVKYNGRIMKRFNEDNGIVNNTVYDIKQDKNNRIFFATLSGISVLNKRSGNIKSYFIGKPFNGIFIDKDDEKWFYGENGIYTINGRKEVFLNDKIPELPKNVHSMTGSSKSGNIVIASSSGLYILKPDEKIVQLSNEYCHYAFFDKDGNLWTSLQSGLYYSSRVDIGNYKIGKKINRILKQENIIIRSISQDRDGSIWLISDYKVFQLLTLKQKPIVYDSRIGLTKYRILTFTVDKERNLWFGYSGGLQKLTNKSLRNIYPEYLNSYINSIFEDQTGRIWFGMDNEIYFLKNGLVRFNENLDTEMRSYVIGELPIGDIIIANPEGLYVVDIKTAKLKKTKKFKNLLFQLDDVFISSKGEIFLITGVNGIVYYMKDFNSDPVQIENDATRLISQITEINGKIIGGNSTGLVEFKDNTFQRFINLESQVWTLKNADIRVEDGSIIEIVYVGTQTGLGILKPDMTFEYINSEKFSKVVINAISPAEDDNKIWLGTNNGIWYYNMISGDVEFEINTKDGLSGNEITIDGLYLDGRGLLWIGTYHGPATFDIKKRRAERQAPQCFIETYKINGEYVDAIPAILKSGQNNLIFEISGLSFKDEKSVEYEYYLQGLDNEFSGSTGKDNIARYQNLPSGKYSFKYRAKGKDGVWSYYKSIDFEITKPFYLEWWFIVLSVLLSIFLIWLVFRWRIKILKRKNEKLEATIAERTQEIREKNAELETQKEEIQAQRDMATAQRDEIAQQKKEIEDSILYAKRIQNAILPPEKFISDTLNENFILFKPRDIVSGDFYWVAKKGECTYFAAADCTGHGVPGAFMSMLGTSFLNEIINSAGYEIEASVILDKLRANIIRALHQTGEVHEAKDGMDIALCKLNYQTMEVEFAGAFNPLYIVRNGEIIVIDADRMPIGIYEYEGDNKDFTNQKVKVEKGDILYVFSDGYPDQFGGSKGKKFMIGRFKKVLQKAAEEMTMVEQRAYLDEVIENWRSGVSDQIDDILVIGVKIV